MIRDGVGEGRGYCIKYFVYLAMEFWDFFVGEEELLKGLRIGNGVRGG